MLILPPWICQFFISSGPWHDILDNILAGRSMHFLYLAPTACVSSVMIGDMVKIAHPLIIVAHCVDKTLERQRPPES